MTQRPFREMSICSFQLFEPSPTIPFDTRVDTPVARLQTYTLALRLNAIRLPLAAMTG